MTGSPPARPSTPSVPRAGSTAQCGGVRERSGTRAVAVPPAARAGASRPSSCERPAPARCASGWKAAASAAPICRCGKGGPGSPIRSVPGRRDTRAGGRSMPWARASTDVAVGDRVALLSDNAYADYDIAPASAVVRLPAALAGRAFPGEPLACVDEHLPAQRDRSRADVAIVGIGFIGAALDGARRARGCAGHRSLAPAVCTRDGRAVGAATPIGLDDDPAAPSRKRRRSRAARASIA